MNRIALIDHDASILTLLTDLFADRGWTTLTREDGDDSLTLLRDEQPDLVLLDLWMAGPTDGWQVLRRLKTDPLTRSIPVILLSEQGDGAQTNAAWLDQSGVSVVPKPFDVDMLYQAVNAALRG